MQLNMLTDKTNSRGVLVKSLFVALLEREYWMDLLDVQKRENLKSVADTVRFCVKRAAGKV